MGLPPVRLEAGVNFGMMEALQSKPMNAFEALE